jgi:hypothetical protein
VRYIPLCIACNPAFGLHSTLQNFCT